MDIGSGSSCFGRDYRCRTRQNGAYPANEKWFVSGSVGAGVYVGDYDMHTKFGNRISITGDVSGGKWITPVLGARLQISGMHASGEAKNGRSESWNFMMYHADIMVDVLNWWCGVDEERTYSLIPLVGGGVANAPGLNTTTGVLTVGVLNRFKGIGTSGHQCRDKR